MPRRLLLAVLVLGSTCLPGPAISATPEFENPNESRLPCQLVQLRQPDGEWSRPYRPSEAREVYRENPRNHRTVPLSATNLYHDVDLPFLITCLVRLEFPDLPGGMPKARRVAACESGEPHGGIYSVNGRYKSVYQMHDGRFRDNAPRGCSRFNGWCEVYAGLRSATLSNWSGWSCQ